MPTTNTATAAPAWHDNPRHPHGLDTVTGYSVVRTDWTSGEDGKLIITRTEVALIGGARSYGAAVQQVHALRAEQERTCGCRSDSIDHSLVR